MPNFKGRIISAKNKFFSLSWKKKIILIIILIAGIIVLINVLTPKKQGYTLAKASKSNITETISETGNIATNGSVNVYSPSTGTVENVYVQNGNTVNEGDELFTVESSATEQEQRAAYASYLAAKTGLDNAQAALHTRQAAMLNAWDEYKSLAEGDKYENSDGSPKSDQRTLPEFHIAEKTWLAAEAEYKNQQTEIAQAQAQTSSTWLLYEATQNAKVKAPASGTVSNLSVISGSSVTANSNLSPAPPVLSIANFQTTEVVVSLGESNISKVQEGQTASIDVSAVHDTTYKGIVKRVDNIGTNTQGVIRYNAYIEVLNPDQNLRPGMNADVEITTNTLTNVLSVPNSAIKPYQGGRAVRVVGPKGEVEYRKVKIGNRGKSKTQILSGIEEGQEVITSLSNEQIKRPGLFGS